MKETEEIDAENRNSIWMDAVRMEMKNFMSAFDEIESPLGLEKSFKEITGHLVFDIKLGEGFRRKALWVADGHKTPSPASVTYSTVVSRDSVRIMLLVAALNNLDVMGVDVQNAYLNAPNREKHWIKAGPEFGQYERKYYIVAKALYELKSAGASFRSFMAKILDNLGFRSCITDPDVWRRLAVKENGTEYYEYVMTYVDDLIAISDNAKKILQQVADMVKLKNNKIEAPQSYLGAKLKYKIIDGIGRWTVSCEDYVNAAINTVEESLKKN